MTLGRYVSILALTCVAVYGALLGVSYVAFPGTQSTTIDTDDSKASLYSTEPKYLVFSLPRLSSDKPRVLLVGGSNVREGFRPQLLSPRLNNTEVDNLAIGAANIGETLQIVRAGYDRMPRSAWKHTTVVVGIWYAMFISNEKEWPGGVNDFANELTRYGLYAREGSVVQRQVPIGFEPEFDSLVRPFILVSRLYELNVTPLITTVRVALLRLAGEQPADVVVNDKNTFHLTPAQRQASLAYWHKFMGKIDKSDNRSFEELIELAQLVSSRGGHLVIVDLPLPKWHAAAVPYDTDYVERVQPYIKRAVCIPNVDYVSLREGFADDDFYDGAHPRPRVVDRWAERAAVAIRPTLD